MAIIAHIGIEVRKRGNLHKADEKVFGMGDFPATFWGRYITAILYSNLENTGSKRQPIKKTVII